MNFSTTKKRACLVMLSIVVVLLLAMSTVAPASAARVKVHRTIVDGAQPEDIIGIWSSEWGDVKFQASGTNPPGCWKEPQAGNKYGIIDSWTYGADTGWLRIEYHGTWSGGISGTANLHLDDKNTLTGNKENGGGWTQTDKDGKTVKGYWTMKRDGKETPPITCPPQ